MIKILQAGQYGSTKYLVEMHRRRTQIFRDRMGWDVTVDGAGLEIDDYDLPETVYILALDEKDSVVGTWRFLTTDRPSMICNLWPVYLKTLPVPRSSAMCETSRFGVFSDNQNEVQRRCTVNKATAEMIVGLIEACQLCGIAEMFTLYNVTIKRLLERIGFKPTQTSAVIDLEGQPTVTARFLMNETLLKNVRLKTGVSNLVSFADLPPSLQDLASANATSRPFETGVAHVAA